MKKLPWYKKVIFTILAPLIILVWALANPKKIWEEALNEFRAPLDAED